MMLYIIQSLMVIPENMALLILQYGCLTTRRNKFLAYVFPMLLYTIWGNIALFLKPSIFRTGIGVIIFFLGTYIPFKEPVLPKLWIMFLSMANALIADFISVIIGLMGSAELLRFMYDNIAPTMEVILAKVLCILGVVVINTIDVYFWNKNKMKLNVKTSVNFILLFAAQIIGMLIVFFAIFRFRVQSNLVGVTFIILSLLSSAMDISLLNTIQKTSQRSLIEEKLRAFERLLDIEFIYYKNMERSIQEIRNIRHDFYNQIQVLELLISDAQRPEAVVRQMTSDIHRALHETPVHRDVFDILAEEWIKQGETRGVCFETRVDMAHNIKDKELGYMVLSELMDIGLENSDLAKKITLNVTERQAQYEICLDIRVKSSPRFVRLEKLKARMALIYKLLDMETASDTMQYSASENKINILINVDKVVA